MTMARRTILPPNATALERAIDQAAPAWDGIADAFTTPAEGEAESFAPWLAAQYHLAQFAPYFDSVQALLAAGLPWLLERGTAAATLRALDWVGFPDATLDERGARLHIQLGRPATAAEISRIAHVVRATVPAHVQFWRVFHGYDRRPVRLDGAQRIDQGLLDDDSGVWIDVTTGEPVKASFGAMHRSASTAAAAGQPLPSATAARIAKLTRNDKAVLDCWRLDSRLLANEFGGLGELMRGEAPAYARQPTEGGMPGVIDITETTWSAPAQEAASTNAAVGEHPPAMPQPKGWAGTWGVQRWRPIFIESKSTEST